MGKKSNKIKIGICEWAIPTKFQGTSCCRFASDFGIQGIELELGGYMNDFPLTNEYVQAVYLEEKEKYKIEFPSLAANSLCEYGKMYLSETEDGQIGKTTVKKAIDTAAKMRIPLVQLPFFQKNEISSEEELKKVAEFLSVICDCAKEHGIIIGAETALSKEKNRALVEMVAHENFKIYFDIQNPFAMAGYQVPEMALELLDDICEVHIKDGCHSVLSSSLLGQGENCTQETIDIFIKSGYQGWFILENYYDHYPLVEQGDDPYELLKKDIKTLDNWINNI